VRNSSGGTAVKGSSLANLAKLPNGRWRTHIIAKDTNAARSSIGQNGR
jgi:hypothetical protein